jgi:uncharacterized protein (TIGR02996 family)
MRELRALLEGIARYPADDLRRWVLADWLDERNYIEGTWLRTALNFRGWETEPIFPHPFHEWLDTAIPHLLRKLEPLLSRQIYFSTNCGLVDQVELSSFQLAGCGRWLTELYPIRSIILHWNPNERDDLALARNYTNLSHITELSLHPVVASRPRLHGGLGRDTQERVRLFEPVVPQTACEELFTLPLFQSVRGFTSLFGANRHVSTSYQGEMLTALLRFSPKSLKRLRLLGPCWEKRDFFRNLVNHPLIHQLEMLELDEISLSEPSDFLECLNQVPKTMRELAFQFYLDEEVFTSSSAENDFVNELLKLRVAWAKEGRILDLRQQRANRSSESWRAQFDPLYQHLPKGDDGDYWYDERTDDRDDRNWMTDEEEATQFGRVFPTGTPSHREHNRGRFRNPRR